FNGRFLFVAKELGRGLTQMNADFDLFSGNLYSSFDVAQDVSASLVVEKPLFQDEAVEFVIAVTLYPVTP
ncbi:hypothetical protein MNBD_CHLOROFLEXI01-1638, partial [hydrothermal vent metagenome]